MTFDTIETDRPLRGVVVGAGFIGGQWAPELLAHPQTALAGWVDGEEPDFIVNCTVPQAHHDVTVTALQTRNLCYLEHGR